MPRKDRAAAVSIVSNALLIVLKLAAAAITGSIAILTEAVHSSIDLIASVVAFFSVRKADEPADEDHPYGHQKVENLAAAIEGMLILLGAGIIVFESVRRLSQGPEVESLGVGIAVIGFSAVANLVVSGYLYRRARATDSPALEGDAAHLRTDAFTSIGVLVGLVLVEITGVQAFDPITALLVAGAIVFAGLRILSRSSRALVDEALPAPELDVVRQAIAEHGAAEVVGFHKLRARRAGSRRYVDLHVQFREGTSLQRAHEISHELQDAITARLRGADVLIHLEPGAGAPLRRRGSPRRRRRRRVAPASSRSSRRAAAGGRRPGRCRRSPATRFGTGARRYSDRDAGHAHSRADRGACLRALERRSRGGSGGCGGRRSRAPGTWIPSAPAPSESWLGSCSRRWTALPARGRGPPGAGGGAGGGRRGVRVRARRAGPSPWWRAAPRCRR